MTSPSHFSVAEQKAALRSAALARRDALDPAVRIDKSIAACDHALAAPEFSRDTFLPGTVVSGFYPIRSEIDLRPLLAGLAARDARLCLPVVMNKTTIVFRELEREAPLVSTGFGTIGPDETARVLDPSILLVPLSVFDKRGGRIGYGAGHYDRAIERLIKKGISPRLLGMAFSVQEEAEVPVEQHDQPLHGIITELGYLPVS